MPVPAAIQSVEKIGELLCESIDLLKKAGISSPIIDEADQICKAVLPELDTLSLSSGAQLAEAAYSAFQKIRGLFSK